MDGFCPYCVQVHESELAHEVSLADVLLPDAPASLFGDGEITATVVPSFMRPVDIERRIREEFLVEQEPLDLDA